MPEESEGKKRHFILEGFSRTEAYQRPGGGGETSDIPERNRRQHGRELSRQLRALRAAAAAAAEAQRQAGLAEEDLGLRIEFESFPDVELAFESLARERSGIELLNVRQLGRRTLATVLVPDGKLNHFEKVVHEYLEEHRTTSGRVRDHKRLVNAIRSIRKATLRALWTDDPALLPTSPDKSFWWEVWLPVRRDRRRILAGFHELANAQRIAVSIGHVEFPERTVVLARASASQMTRSMLTLNSVAELRRAKETAEFFDSLPVSAQSDWMDDLLTRARFAPSSATAPHVCILDTGVNRGHPFLERSLATADLHTVEPGWGVDDQHSHGTEMAGLALGGDLAGLLDGAGPVAIDHRLESVKLLPGDGANGSDARHHGYVTTEAIARPEITSPDRPRVFSLAVTARDNRDRGRPSAWSATLDRLASDAENLGEHPRLIVVSAGNIDDRNAWAEYPESNKTDGVHDPGQAWNVLTVGACTGLVHITEADAADHQAIAPLGGLSPFSTTSLTWPKDWPLKPDVLLEGGNAARDRNGALTMTSLSVLTTHYRPAERLITISNATSAATALASRMAAQVMAAYPTLWPETIRGLIVHSAEWTEGMRQMFLPARPSKRDFEYLAKCCGFGAPDLNRALWSVSNSLTMVMQENLHPFQRKHGKDPILRDMQLHDLPWPTEVLAELAETEVEMRVTLSYFIEPNPSRRGLHSRYRYESHGLRFDVRRPGEDLQHFRSRVNAAARDEEEGARVSETDANWLIGKQNRHRGSLHSDIWRGTAADLASRGALAVYPALGWWKTRTALERYNQRARYALIVSIKAPGVDVDLYSEIASKVGISVAIET